MTKLSNNALAVGLVASVAGLALLFYAKLPMRKPDKLEPDKPQRVTQSPVSAPPSAIITRHILREQNQPPMVVFTIVPDAPAAPGTMNVRDALAPCQQTVSSREYTHNGEPDNFIHITGQCLGHAFAFPPSGNGRPCAVQFNDKTFLVVRNCVVDGALIRAIAFQFAGFPNSKTLVVLPSQS